MEITDNQGGVAPSDDRGVVDSSTNKRLIVTFLAFLKDRFNLSGEDNASQKEVMDNIKKGVEFKGANLWVLIFAIFVASIGLNVNSTAVIIGAMLISPLMGPIMGVGLAVGVNDFELMKRSLKSFGLAVGISLTTSTFYFMMTPLTLVQSELLARTTPNAWDVLIAFFGGLAGIVAQSRKDPAGTVVSGVAIATALMPPLCTAGYGLATWQLSYFLGAFYLFFINAVFISVATYVIVRFLKYEKKQFVDPSRERRVRRSIMFIVVVTIVPSVILGYRIVNRSVFEANAQTYVAKVFNFPETQVVDYKAVYNPKESSIEVILIGRTLPKEVLATVENQMATYKLGHTKLIVKQSEGESEVNAGMASLTSIDKLYNLSSALLEEKDKTITQLQRQVSRYAQDSVPVVEIGRELLALTDKVTDVAMSKTVMYKVDGQPLDTVLVCILRTRSGRLNVGAQERLKLINWLKVRTNSSDVKLIVE